MKTFVQVIKKIMKHLTEKENFNKQQHGFVPGRSIQNSCSLISMIYFDTLAKKKKTDTMYLVFAKVFDKVDHEILLEKIKNTK